MDNLHGASVLFKKSLFIVPWPLINTVSVIQEIVGNLYDLVDLLKFLYRFKIFN